MHQVSIVIVFCAAVLRSSLKNGSAGDKYNYGYDKTMISIYQFRIGVGCKREVNFREFGEFKKTVACKLAGSSTEHSNMPFFIIVMNHLNINKLFSYD